MRFNNKTKSFIASHKIFFGFFVAWFSFVCLIAPLKAFAYKDYSIGDINYRVYSSTEQQSSATPAGMQSIFLQPGQTFNPNTGDISTTVDAGEPLPEGPANPAKASTNPDAYKSDGGQVGDLAQKSIATLGTCSIGAILGKLLSSLIGSLINTLTGFITGVAIEAGMQIADCVTHFLQICGYNPSQANSSAKLVQKTVGGSVPAPSGLIGSYIPTPSLDSIMFCIVNEILTYITQATINWINSGFNGNPVFVQNPGALLQTVADQEANSFITNLTKGINQTTGSNGLGVSAANGSMVIYPAVANSVVNGLITGYNTGISQFAAQRPNYLPQNSAGLNSYLSGSTYINQPSRMLMEMPAYSSWYQQQVYQSAMQQQIAASQQNAQIRMQNGYGFISPTTCANGYKRPDGTCANLGIQDTASAHQIASTLQNRDMMTYTRVAMAKDFDSIITALVNQLIKIAVTDLFKGTGITPTTVYSTGLGLSTGSAPKAIPVNPTAYDANGNPIPKALPVGSTKADAGIGATYTNTSGPEGL